MTAAKDCPLCGEPVRNVALHLSTSHPSPELTPATAPELARTTKPKRDLPAGSVGRVVSDGRSSGVALVEFKTPSGLRREALSSNEYELFDPKAAR